MTGALLTLPAHLRQRLAQALDTGLITTPYAPAALRATLGLPSGGADTVTDITTDIATDLAELAAMGVSGPAAAAWLRSLDAALHSTPRPDLVWSGPEVPGVHARDTRRVYEELLGSAERSIWVSTYAYFDGPRAFEVLARLMDQVAGLQVTLLLNIRRQRGDTRPAPELVRRFADRFWNTDWPGAARPAVYYDPRALEPDSPGGVLHAKTVVADTSVVFVTSANLTAAAWDRNIELGLLVRDRALAASVVSHCRGLIERGVLGVLPGP